MFLEPFPLKQMQKGLMEKKNLLFNSKIYYSIAISIIKIVKTSSFIVHACSITQAQEWQMATEWVLALK